jgi:hypothetical protein
MLLLERTPPALEKREAHLPRWAFSMSHSCLPESHALGQNPCLGLQELIRMILRNGEQ